MFIQATNRQGVPLLINTDAIAHIELNAAIVGKTGGVRIFFRVTTGKKEGSAFMEYQEFVGETAEKLRTGLPKILEAPSFD